MRIKKFIPAEAKNGIALPVIRVDSVDYDLEKLSSEDLNNLRISLELQGSEIELQLENAAARFNEEGVASEWTWVTGARFVRKLKGHQLQAIQAEQNRRRVQRGLSDRFMEVARRRLSMVAFNEILLEAKGDET